MSATTFTVGRLYAEVTKDINQDTFTCLFGEGTDGKQYFLEKLDNALEHVYSYHHRLDRFVINETIIGTGPTFTPANVPDEILALKYVKEGETNEGICLSPTAVQSLGCACDSTDNKIKFFHQGATINMPSDVTFQQVTVTYRKCAPSYATAAYNENTVIDVPYKFKSVLKDLILEEILHLWLQEGAGAILPLISARRKDSLLIRKQREIAKQNRVMNIILQPYNIL